MPPPTGPSSEDHVDAVRLVLLGLATGEDLDSIMDRLGQLHLPNDTFPAEVLLKLAAGAIAESGASQAEPIELEGIRERYLSEYEFRGKSQQHKSHYALTAAAMIRAGIYPDLLGEVWARAFAGRGGTPTALALAMDQCFFGVGLHRVEATIRPENMASRRVVEKLGFREEGVRRRCLHIDGAWHDHICYALTVEDAPNGLMPRWRSSVMSSRLRTG